MNASEEPDVRVRSDLRAGVWADHVDVFGEFGELTLDFARLDPRLPSRGELVARVALSRWCILKLQEEFERRTR